MNFKGRSIYVFTKVWVRPKLLYLGVIFIYVLTNISKETKRKNKFDELPKASSRIKIITIKIIRFKTKTLTKKF